MIVLDCNAAIAIFNGSDEGKALRLLMHDGEKAIAPDIFKVEAANVLRKYSQAGGIDPRSEKESLVDMIDMIDDFHSIDSLIFEAYRESIRLKHPIYDMLYFVLARRTMSTVFTLDKRLQRICLENDVQCVFTDNDFGKN